MKTILISLIMLLAVPFVKGQDKTLPQNISRIYLYSGKTIREAYLWKIDTLVVEYVRNGNLSDVPAADVNYIDAGDYLVTFDSSRRFSVSEYDKVFMQSGDTVKGIIQSVETNRIKIRQPGRDQIRIIPSYAYSGYSIRESKPPRLFPAERKDTVRADSLYREQNDILQGDKSDTLKLIQEGNKIQKEDLPVELSQDASYYLESYQAGVQKARGKDYAGWAVGGFFLGMIYGSPYLCAAAINSGPEYISVPEGNDPKLFQEGYQREMVKLKTKNATAGAAAAKGVWTLILIILLL